MRIGDAGFYARLTELLQARDPRNIPDLIDPDQVGLTISIPADLLLSKARRAALPLGPTVTKEFADPAAGANFSLTVPDGRIWLVRSLRGLFTTGVTVANRYVELVLLDGTKELARMTSIGAQGASEPVIYTWAIGGPQQFNLITAGTKAGNIPMIQLALGPGFVLTSNVASKQATDQWTLLKAQVEDYPA